VLFFTVVVVIITIFIIATSNTRLLLVPSTGMFRNDDAHQMHNIETLYPGAAPGTRCILNNFWAFFRARQVKDKTSISVSAPPTRGGNKKRSRASMLITNALMSIEELVAHQDVVMHPFRSCDSLMPLMANSFECSVMACKIGKGNYYIEADSRDEYFEHLSNMVRSGIPFYINEYLSFLIRTSYGSRLAMRFAMDFDGIVTICNQREFPRSCVPVDQALSESNHSLSRSTRGLAQQIKGSLIAMFSNVMAQVCDRLCLHNDVDGDEEMGGMGDMGEDLDIGTRCRRIFHNSLDACVIMLSDMVKTKRASIPDALTLKIGVHIVMPNVYLLQSELGLLYMLISSLLVQYCSVQASADETASSPSQGLMFIDPARDSRLILLETPMATFFDQGAFKNKALRPIGSCKFACKSDLVCNCIQDDISCEHKNVYINKSSQLAKVALRPYYPACLLSGGARHTSIALSKSILIGSDTRLCSDTMRACSVQSFACESVFERLDRLQTPGFSGMEALQESTTAEYRKCFGIAAPTPDFEQSTTGWNPVSIPPEAENGIRRLHALLKVLMATAVHRTMLHNDLYSYEGFVKCLVEVKGRLAKADASASFINLLTGGDRNLSESLGAGGPNNNNDDDDDNQSVASSSSRGSSSSNDSSNNNHNSSRSGESNYFLKIVCKKHWCPNKAGHHSRDGCVITIGPSTHGRLRCFNSSRDRNKLVYRFFKLCPDFSIPLYNVNTTSMFNIVDQETRTSIKHALCLVASANNKHQGPPPQAPQLVG
jgi:hypothetical protein